MTTIDKMLQKLGSEYVHGYGNAPLPHMIDEEVESLIDAVTTGNGENSEVLSKMNEQHGFLLLAYAERMASLAVREKEKAILEKSMAALGIASMLTYVKENIPILSLIYNSAEKLGVDAKEFFALSTANLKSELKPYVDAFSDRSEEDRSIQAMGYVESEDEQGFCYLRTW